MNYSFAKIRFAVVTLLLIAFSLTVNAQSPDNKVPGVIRVKIKPELVTDSKGLNVKDRKGKVVTGLKELDEANKKFSAGSIRRVFPYSQKFEDKHMKYGLHLWYEISFPSKAAPTPMAEVYKELAEVEHAEAVSIPRLIDGSGAPHYVSLASAPMEGTEDMPFDDPYLVKQWHYDNRGQSGGTVGADISLFEAWNITTGSEDVIVAIMDQGVDYAHEDLHGNMWVNEAELNGVEGVDDDENGYRDDIYGANFEKLTGNIAPMYHGTHVAGTVAAINNNGIGVSGVAGGSGNNDGVRIMSCQILGGPVASDIPSAFVYSADMGAVISQNSWGYPQAEVFEEAVRVAIDYFIAEAGNYPGSPMKGGVVIFASGNMRTDRLMYPAAYEKVIAVNGLNSNNTLAGYSNYGTWTDISAPGGDVDDDVVLGGEVGYSNGIMSTLDGNAYGFLDGTSMACPHVSGIAALVVSKHGGPQFTAEILKKHILTGVDYIYDIPDNEELAGQLGVGAANAEFACARDNGLAPDKITDLAIDGIAQDFVNLSWTVPGDADDNFPVAFEVLYSTKEITSSTLDYAKSATIPNRKEEGESIAYTLNNLQSVTEYWFNVRSIDRWGNTSSLSNPLSDTTNNGPITEVNPEKTEIELSINITQDSVGIDSIEIFNHGEGLLRFEALTRLRSAEAFSRKADFHYPVAPGHQPAQPNIIVKENVPVPLGILKDSTITRGYVDPWVNLKIFGESDISLPNSSATRFYVDDEEGFNLTDVDVYLEWDDATGPVILEIFEGYDIANAKLLHVQEVAEDEDYGYNYVKLDNQIYFENGKYFWCVFHVPVGNKYPLGGGLELSGELSENCYYSTNVGETWTLFEDVYPDKRVVWAVYAVSLYERLEKFLEIKPDSGIVASNESQYISAKVNATEMINGLYKSNLVVYTNETEKPYVKVPVNVTVTGHLPEMTSVKRNDFGGVIIGEAKEIDVTIENTGLGRFTFEAPFCSVTDDQFIYLENMESKIESGSSHTMRFRFAPSNPGNNYCFVTLHDENGNDYEFELFGAGLEPPVAELHPEENRIEDIAIGDSISGEFFLKNEGKYPLDYYLPALADGSNMEEIPANIQKFGYTYSVDTTGSSFEWTDISSTGTAISENFKDNSRESIFHKIDLNFLFPFYGKNENSLYISEYGVLSFDTNNHIWSISPLFFDSPANPDRYISGCGFSMQFFEAGFGEVYYQQFADKVIVQYEKAPYWDGVGYIVDEDYNYTTYEAWITFQFVLYDNGDIDLFYKDASIDAHSADYTLIAIEDKIQEDGVLIKGGKYRDYSNYKFLSDFTYSAQSAIHIKNPGLGLFKDVTNPYGTILPGDSTEITYTLDTDSLSMLEYTENMLIVTNDPFNNPATHRVIFNITSGGSPLVELDTAYFHFDTLYTGAERTESFLISNSGNAIDSVKSAHFVNGYYNIEGNLPEILKPDRKLEYRISIITDTPGLKEDTLVMTTALGEELRIALTGLVTDGPILELQTSSGSELTSITRFMNAGSSKTYTFKIHNPGVENLEVAPVPNEWAHISEVVETPNEFETTYAWKSSLDYGGPLYDWIEIAEGAGTRLEGLNAWEGPMWSEGIKMPFTFNFYGQDYDTLYVGDNGVMTFTEGQDDFAYYFTVPGIPVEGIPDNYIAPLFLFGGMDWIVLFPYTGQYYKLEEDRVIVEFKDFNSAFGMGYPISAEAILYENGNIKYQYLMPPSGDQFVSDKAVIGIENQDGTEGVEISNRTNYVNSNMSIMLYPIRKWSIAPGETKEFQLDFDAADLVAGTYGDSMLFMTNDPYNLEKELPIKIVVTGEGEISLPDSIDFGDILINPNESQVISEEFEVSNTGTDNFNITDLFQKLPEKVKLAYYEEEILTMGWNGYSETEDLFPYTIKPGESLKMKVSINVETAESIADTLVFTTSLPTTGHSIVVKADIYDPPVIEVSDDTISYYARLEDFTKTHNLVISNPGSYELRYKLLMEYHRQSNEPQGSEEIMSSGKPDYKLLSVPVSARAKKSSRKSGQSETDFNRILAHDNADTAQTRLGYGGARAFHVGTGFEAPSVGFNLTHVQTWYVPEDWLDSRIQVNVLGGHENINNCKVLHSEEFSHSITETNPFGSLVTFELSKNIEFYPNEKFYIVFIYESALTYPQGCVEVGESAPNRFMYGDGSGFYDLIEAPDFKTLGWMTRAAEKTASNKPWLVMNGADTGIVDLSSSINVPFEFTAKSAVRGDNYATLSIHSNDVVTPLKEVVLHLRRNAGPEFFYEGELNVRENDTLVFDLTVYDKEGDSYSYEAPDLSNVKILTSTETTVDDVAGNLLKVQYVPDFNSQGLRNLVFTGVDRYDNSSSYAVQVQVSNVNRIPEPIQLDTLHLALNEQSDLLSPEKIFDDPDGDIVFMLAEVSDTAVVEMFSSQLSYILYPRKEGLTSIDFAATDSYGVTATNRLHVKVGGSTSIVKQKEESCILYPNPTNGFLNFILPEAEKEDLNISVYNNLGMLIRIVELERGVTHYQMNFSELESGLYFVKIQGDSLNQTSKIIKN